MTEKTYKEALVTYIDVLAFKEFVRASENEPTRIGEIDRILLVLKTQLTDSPRFKYAENRPPEQLFRAFSFSDLTVRATLINPENDLLNIFNREIQILAEKQLELACWGGDDWETFPVLLRGAISMGPILMDPVELRNDQIFGPALVRSYELESETSVFPRIVIDRGLMKKVNNPEDMLYRQFITRGDDGVDFVNYLSGCTEYFQAGEPITFHNSSTTFENHKRMIEKAVAQLKKAKKKPGDRIIQKYLWLVNYHNRAVDQIPLSGPEEVPAVFPGEPDEESVEQTSLANREALKISEDLLNF
ncbi:MAG TPA: hypothetical protein VI636_14150 [Candidatus Angelobacter sp.]